MGSFFFLQFWYPYRSDVWMDVDGWVDDGWMDVVDVYNGCIKWMERRRDGWIIYWENYSSIEKHLKTMLGKHIPCKMSRTRVDVPWLSPGLKRQCRRKQRLYNRAKKSGKADHKAAYIRARKSVQSALKQARWGYINGILQAGLDEGTSKPFWGYIRQQRQDNVGVSPLKKDGKPHADSLSRCEILASQFKSVFTKDSDDPLRDTALFGPSYPPIDPLIIREEGIRKLLSGVNPSKAAGPDQVPCRLLKELSNELSPIFTYLFKQSLATGKLPSFWHTAWVTPVFKKGPRNLPENYRPVSLTCVVCKLMEHVVSSHIRSHLDKHGILTPYNHGFSAGCSCESQLLLTTHDMYRKLDQQGGQVDVAVLDFSKAFDTVPHQRLLRKLGLCGINGDTHTWISEFLCHRTQSVMVEGVRSHEDSVDSGVPQGTVLGPLLFLIYISDLPSVLDPDTAVRLFADDCLVYRSVRGVEDQRRLQQDLDALSLWGDCWGMRFNASKCNIIHMGNVKSQFFYQLNNHILQSVPNAVYLGVTLTHDLSWSQHVATTVSKAHQRLGFIRRNLRGSPYKCRETAFIALTRSQLEYCSSIWDPILNKDSDSIEKVQRKAARWARGQYGSISVTQLLKDLKWRPLADRRRDHRIILLYKILHGSVNIPPETVDIRKSKRTPRGVSNPDKLERPRATRKSSPLWNSTVFRTIPEWNQLPASIAEADSITSFKSRLACASP